MSAQEETVTATPEIPLVETPAADAHNSQIAAADTTQDREANGRFKNPVQPRIDELTRKVRENEREAAYWRARAEAASAPPAKEPPKKPTPDQFDDYSAYVEALTDFKADEKVNTALDARDKANTAKQEAQTRVTTWNDRVIEARKTIPDYDAVMAASEVPVAEHILDELRDSELGPQLAYHLDKNPDVAEKLNTMNPRQAAREIGRLEAKLMSTASASPDPKVDAPQEPPAPKVKTTNAPPPVKPVGQGRSTAVDLAKAGMDDYIAARKAQGATWAR